MSSKLNFETAKLDQAVTDAGLKLNDLIVSHIYDYDVDTEGYIIKICKHSKDFIITNEKEATCTEEGYTGDKVCPDCSVIIEKGTVTSKLSHEFENGTCINCGELDQNFKPEDTQKPEDTLKPEDTQKPNTENNSDNKTDLPQTGDDINLYTMIGIAIISITGLIYLRKTISR